ncbi:MAG: deoxyhypusine synthase [archaeon]
MKRKELEPVKDIDPSKIKAKELIEQYEKSGGFTSKLIADADKILKEIKEKGEDTHFFLSFPACIISTGARGVIKELIKTGEVDTIITTCGMLDHDLARTWKEYYRGSFGINDKELQELKIHRLGNILIPQECYGPVIEKKLQPILKEINQEYEELSTSTLTREIGKRIDDKDSILHWAAEKNVDIYVPGITDGAVGTQIWTYQQENEFNVNIWKDEDELAEIVFEEKDTSALMIGGGISKHHVIWWNQFKEGLDRAVYITTAPEWDGSLSGARLEEAISWNKLKKEAEHVTIPGEATAILPILVANFLRKNK